MKLRNNWLLIYLMLSLSVSGQTFLKHFAIDSVGTQSFSLSLADSFIFVAGVCASGNSLLGSTGGCPPAGEAPVIVAPASAST